MTHIKKTYKIKKLDDLDISKRMRKDKIYYHCVKCGNLYEDKHQRIIMNETKFYSLPFEFNGYKISSGLCKKCFEGRRK